MYHLELQMYFLMAEIKIFFHSCLSQTSVESRYDVNTKWDFHTSLNTVTFQWQIQSKYVLNQDDPFDNLIFTLLSPES